MVDTVSMVITDQWVKVADGACEVQSVIDRDAFNKTLFDVVVGSSTPAPNTNAFMRIELFEHANFHRNAPVWLRLNAANANKPQSVVVTK